MQAASILIVDDDTRLCALMADYLNGHGYSVSQCHDGYEAVKRIQEQSLDLVVLDLMLPGMDGLAICREVRSTFKGKILMLTALEDTAEEITGLELGADDYVTKPVSPRLLLARIRLLLRRAASSKEDTVDRVELGDLTVDNANRDVILNGSRLKLTTTEFDLLWLLASNAGTPVSRNELHTNLFRLDITPDDRRIDLLISRLRKKIGDDSTNPKYLKTVRGKGYMLGKG